MRNGALRIMSTAPSLVLLVLLGLVLMMGCEEKNTYAPPPPPEVTVGKPEQRMVTDFAEFTGTTAPYEFVEIRARVEGWLESVHFQASQRVKKGDLLFKIDPRPYQAELDIRKADMLIREAEFKLAETTLARKESAFKDRAISEVEVIEARARLEQAKAAIKAAEGAIEKAELDLSYTEIHAPIDGRIGRSLVDAGNLVGVGGEKTILATIVDDDPIHVYFSISERFLLSYKKKAREEGKIDPSGSGPVGEKSFPVFLGLANEEGHPHEGTLDYIENRVDSETGTIEIRGVFENPDGMIHAGMFARLRIPKGEPENALLITERAIGTDQRGNYLFTVTDENEVVYTPVATGALIDGNLVIEKGLEPDDRVIVNGILRARPGIKVNPKEQGQAAAPDGGKQESGEPAGGSDQK